MKRRTIDAGIAVGVLVMAFTWAGLVTSGASAQGDPTPLPDLDNALELAQNFSGGNADWEPVIREFDGVEMVLVPAGCFMMGSTDDEIAAVAAQTGLDWYENEGPQHRVCFEGPFWIDRTEVTNAQFAAFHGQAAYASYFSGDDRPREQISWTEAAVFCARRGARLPTEAEWEYAARGPDSLEYPWGNEWDGGKVIWNRSSSEGTASVGSLPAGASWVGALDLSGNVSEWVADWYGTYPAEQQVNPTGSGLGKHRVLRGGSWYVVNSSAFRASVRGGGDPQYVVVLGGVRCARSADADAVLSGTTVGQIAFESDRDGNWEIYVMNADGSDPRRLTDHSAVDWSPAWSLDGSQIAFVSNRDAKWGIYVMNADGSDPHNLIPSTFDSSPARSPDGSQIAFVSEGRGSGWEIYVVNADGSHLRRLTDNSVDDNYYSPPWSPDGRQIAFVSRCCEELEIYVVNADGSHLRRLTDNSAADAFPVWSPDGSQIAFVSYRDGNVEVYAMNIDGSHQRNLTNSSAFDGSPVWSPDGRQILFDSERDGNWEIYVVNADGSDLHNLTNNSAHDSFPVWSPALGTADVATPIAAGTSNASGRR
jgi:Tol biopolymer transport system component/formylglycine-generating enzyme required for sulfatase activity